MSTLGILKTTIADDLTRSDLSAQISAAIDQAVNFYAASRFYFAETNLVTLETAADEGDYQHDDMEFNDGEEPVRPVRIEAVLAMVDGENLTLRRIDPYEMELLHQGESGESFSNADTTGVPREWSYYGQTFSLWPVPDDAYTVRIMGLFRRGAPETDTETGNVWMTEAFELIRCRAKLYLALHTLIDPELATAMAAADSMARDRLSRETALLGSTGRIIPTAF